uniref:Non-haem dioxygenase N-terminal domain-containing protein n=1 Tax=Brassica oleracea var. oleracea TaxID=109376 RepID=A0A0D3EH58_BRAOL
MENEKGESSSIFKMGNSAQERSLPYVPDCYAVPPSYEPRDALDSNFEIVPTIDISRLKGSDDERRGVIQELSSACQLFGFFQIVNHGINQNILDDALEVAHGFFELPAKEKKKFMSNDVYAPVRYTTSIKDGLDKIQFWRIFLKHYAHPLHRWIHLWPQNPPEYSDLVYYIGVGTRFDKVVWTNFPMGFSTETSVERTGTWAQCNRHCEHYELVYLVVKIRVVLNEKWRSKVSDLQNL